MFSWIIRSMLRSILNSLLSLYEKWRAVGQVEQAEAETRAGLEKAQAAKAQSEEIERKILEVENEATHTKNELDALSDADVLRRD